MSTMKVDRDSMNKQLPSIASWRESHREPQRKRERERESERLTAF
jgi:hypothetical protein